MDDYSDHPQSITEIKANKSTSCADWTPRDALIDVLRKIDSGELKIDALVVAYRAIHDNGKSTHYSMATPDSATGLGLMNRAQFMINSEL